MSLMCPRPFLVAVAVLLAASLIGMPPAAAKTRTSTGLVCTKVGTPRSDRIVGTAHRDVICGRGGHDIIIGGAGNDVIDGGPGTDSLSGGTGNDTLVGSAGDDVIDAGTGNDSISAGVGNDRVEGGAGNDRVTGSDGNDTVVGSDGNDVLQGGNGNDDLSGGAGVDVVDGGAGTDWCDVGGEDRQGSCVRDAQEPVIRETRLSSTSLDVTNGSVPVTVLVRATDDTGIRAIQVSASTTPGGHYLDSWYGVQRTSGNARDGWYRVSLTMPRYMASTDVSIHLMAVDRVNRQTWASGPGLHVTGNDPDREAPIVVSTSVTPGSVDVRRTQGYVTIKARIRDDKSGVGQVLGCPVKPTSTGFVRSGECLAMSRASGTTRDGSWESAWYVPQNLISGQWDIRLCIEDRSHENDGPCWVGPGEAAYAKANGLELTGPTQPAPGASLTVLGLDADTHPPELTSVIISPGEVDASAAARTAYADVAARDVEGIMHVRLQIHPDDATSGPIETSYDPTLVSGTPRDGVWRFRIDIPRGAPAGAYFATTTIEDNMHRITWRPADHQISGDCTRAYTPDQVPGGDSLLVR
jgi:hypothetical protein